MRARTMLAPISFVATLAACNAILGLDERPLLPDVPDTTASDAGDNDAPADATGAPNDAGSDADAAEAPAFDWRNAVLYQIVTDRFFDGDPASNCTVGDAATGAGYVGGDFQGITQKIQAAYFDDLGINTLVLTVPIENANVADTKQSSDSHLWSAFHGGWPTELDKVESCFGGATAKMALTTLVTTAHAHGLRVMFDYTMAHVHVSSPLRTQHADWFWPNDNGSGGTCVCGTTCSWSEIDKCWLTDNLARWNYGNLSARQASVDAIVNLVKDTGADGLRLADVKLLNLPWAQGLRNGIESSIAPLRPKGQRFFVVGDYFEYNDRSAIKSFVDPATKLDGQLDYPLRLSIVRALLLRDGAFGLDDLATFMSGNDGFYGSSAIMTTFLGNQDLPRSVHFAEDPPLWSSAYDIGYDKAWSGQPAAPTPNAPYERLANAFGLLFTTPGVPMIFFGDEYGLPGAGAPDNARAMKFNLFDAPQTYVRDRVKAFAKARAAHPALRWGTRSNVQAPTKDLWIFKMYSAADADTVYVAINRGDTDAAVTTFPAIQFTELVTGDTIVGPNVTVPARQTRIYAQ